MKIETEFEVGDRVWIAVRDNEYIWGKIFSVDIRVASDSSVEVVYNIKNRFYEDPYRNYRMLYAVSSMGRYLNGFTDCEFFTVKDSEVFATENAVIDSITLKFEDKIDDIKEMKKGIFNG